MHFTETDKVRLKAIAISADIIDSTDKHKVRDIIASIQNGKDYEPVKVLHDLDHDTYTLTDGLDVYMACWKLGHEWIKVEISF